MQYVAKGHFQTHAPQQSHHILRREKRIASPKYLVTFGGECLQTYLTKIHPGYARTSSTMMATDGPLDGLVRAIERAEGQDRSWFEQHPRRRFRLRYMVIAEFGLHREDPYAGMWNLSYTIVFRSRRSRRMKKWPFWVSLF
jgi:hypothetical protein